MKIKTVLFGWTFEWNTNWRKEAKKVELTDEVKLANMLNFYQSFGDAEHHSGLVGGGDVDDRLASIMVDPQSFDMWGNPTLEEWAKDQPIN